MNRTTPQTEAQMIEAMKASIAAEKAKKAVWVANYVAEVTRYDKMTKRQAEKAFFGDNLGED